MPFRDHFGRSRKSLQVVTCHIQNHKPKTKHVNIICRRKKRLTSTIAVAVALAAAPTVLILCVAPLHADSPLPGQFQSPSGDIACVVGIGPQGPMTGKGAAGCEIRDYTSTAATCPGGAGLLDHFQLNQGEPAHLICDANTDPQTKQPIPGRNTLFVHFLSPACQHWTTAKPDPQARSPVTASRGGSSAPTPAPATSSRCHATPTKSDDHTRGRTAPTLQPQPICNAIASRLVRPTRAAAAPNSSLGSEIVRTGRAGPRHGVMPCHNTFRVSSYCRQWLRTAAHSRRCLGFHGDR
jgi:hypothetical protein